MSVMKPIWTVGYIANLSYFAKKSCHEIWQLISVDHGVSKSFAYCKYLKNKFFSKFARHAFTGFTYIRQIYQCKQLFHNAENSTLFHFVKNLQLFEWFSTILTPARSSSTHKLLGGWVPQKQLHPCPNRFRFFSIPNIISGLILLNFVLLTVTSRFDGWTARWHYDFKSTIFVQNDYKWKKLQAPNCTGL